LKTILIPFFFKKAIICSNFNNIVILQIYITMKTNIILYMKQNTLKSFVLFLLATTSILSYSQTVGCWITTGDKSSLFEEQVPLDLSTDINSIANTITINEATTFQTIDGFGFCMTEGSAEVISGLATVQQDALLNELFDKTTGIGISVIRISIGASDLSASDYTYDDLASGTDLNMEKFSLRGPDSVYLLPILKKALAINPDIKILATPWTAPRWMKSNNAWKGGSLNETYYAAYALYFVKYIDAMKKQGIDIWAITPQNEPENPNNEPSMTMTSAQQLDFIDNHLGPAFADSSYTTKIIAFDHNCDNTAYPVAVCASDYVDGAAFHLYAGTISALTTVHNSTGKNVYFTEQYTGADGSFLGDLGWHMQNVMIGSLNNWAKASIEWNLATNTSYGPRTSGGCSSCLGAITINNSTTFTRNVSYYIVAHMSKFIRPDATRISSTSTNSGLLNVTTKNADGTMALVVYNTANSSNTFKVVNNTESFTSIIPAKSVATYTWTPGTVGIRNVSNKSGVSYFYPNPMLSNSLYFKGSDDLINKKGKLIIKDITGKELYNNEIVINHNNQLLPVDAEKLKPGCIIVSIEFENTLITEKVMIQKE
jgi:glucosylceramidase